MSRVAKNEPDQQEPVNRGARERTLHVRISQGGIDQIDKIALREDRDRSSTIRLMLKYAAKHMPQGWVG